MPYLRPLRLRQSLQKSEQRKNIILRCSTWIQETLCLLHTVGQPAQVNSQQLGHHVTICATSTQTKFQQEHCVHEALPFTEGDGVSFV